MTVSDLLDEFKLYLQPWLTTKLTEIDGNYWEILVKPILSYQQTKNIKIYEINSLAGFDIRALLRILEKNWKGLNKIADRNNLSNEAFNYLKETQTIANRYSHLGYKPSPEDNFRSIDTIKRLSEELGFKVNDFINKCEEELDVIKRNTDNEENDNEDISSVSQQITLFSLSEIFDKRIIFKIPDYQRGFSWEDIQLEQFWDDLINLQDNKIHYTGLLTIDKAKLNEYNFHKWQDVKWLLKEEPEYIPYYIVDGQQRITTMLIIINELINSLKDQDTIQIQNKDLFIKKYLYETRGNLTGLKFSYETDEGANDFFKTLIISNDEHYDVVQTLYIKRLKKAKAFFINKINKDLPQIGQKEEILKKLIENFKFNVYEVGDDLDVSIMFETMNNRGKPLSKLELLKNRLIYLTSLLNNTEEEKIKLRLNINEAWKTIYEYLGKNESEELDDDEFLLNHTYMYFGYEATSYDRILRSLFNDVTYDKNRDHHTIEGKFTNIKVLNNRLTYNSIDSYVDNIKESVKKWFIVKFPIHQSSTLKMNNEPEEKIKNEEIRRYLLKIGRLPFRPFDTIIMAVLLKNYDQEQLLRLLKVMERFAFISFYVLKKQASYKKNNYFGRARSIYQTDINILNLIGELENDIDDSMSNNLSEFRSMIDDLFLTDDGFYDWKGIKYFLFEYEQHLQGDENPKITWVRFQRSDTIEHIYPQTTTDLDCWTDIFGKYREQRRSYLCHNLGNLLALSRSKNSRQSNRCFEDKKSHTVYRHNEEVDEGYFNGSFSEIEVSRYETWTEIEILNRGIKMLEFMEKRWNISLVDKYSKRKLLKLDFINPDDFDESLND